MLSLGTFYNTRIADLRAVQTILLNIWGTKSLPASYEYTLGSILTPLALLLVLNLLASLSTKHGRYMLLLPAVQQYYRPILYALFVCAHPVVAGGASWNLRKQS